MAEQTSWWKPGRVNSAVRVPPPISSWASSTRTERPAAARVTAALSPFGPAPTTTASCTERPARLLAEGPVDGRGELDATVGQPARGVVRDVDDDLVPRVRPVGVVVELLGLEGDHGHEAERLD